MQDDLFNPLAKPKQKQKPKLKVVKGAPRARTGKLVKQERVAFVADKDSFISDWKPAAPQLKTPGPQPEDWTADQEEVLQHVLKQARRYRSVSRNLHMLLLLAFRKADYVYATRRLEQMVFQEFPGYLLRKNAAGDWVYMESERQQVALAAFRMQAYIDQVAKPLEVAGAKDALLAKYGY